MAYNWTKNQPLILNHNRKRLETKLVVTPIAISEHERNSHLASTLPWYTCDLNIGLLFSPTMKRVLLKRGTENGTERKTEWNGKYAMPYTYTCVKHIYTVFVWITLFRTDNVYVLYISHKILLSYSRVKEIWNK